MELYIDHNIDSNMENNSIPQCILQLQNELKTTAYNINDEYGINDVYDINDSCKHDNITASILNYQENYSVKSLKHIAEYYGEKIHSRVKKQQLINFIVFFEYDINNSEIVSKRKLLWGYLDTLLEDKFMKKFVINI
jgi:hypothetical protein